MIAGSVASVYMIIGMSWAAKAGVADARKRLKGLAAAIRDNDSTLLWVG